MSKKLKRRFIAAAICPKCQAEDTLMLYVLNDVEQVECVECGHLMSQPKDDVAKKTRAEENVIGVFKPQ